MDKCPLTGKPCQHQKVIHITDVANNYATDIKDLCSFCGVEYLNKIDPTFNAPASKILDFLNNIIEQASGKIFCPQCGITLQEIDGSGRMGCQECYNYYKETFAPVIEKFHGSLKHKGKVPKSRLFEKLTKDLKAAIAEEKYEEAKIIKDQLDKLK